MRVVRLDPFCIDAVAVSNHRFARFVEDTQFIIDAERLGSSFVFRGFLPAGQHVQGYVPGALWWALISGANWRGAGRSRFVDRRAQGSSGDTCFLGRCSSVLQMGWRQAFDGGGMGMRGARRSRPEAFPMRQRACARGSAPLQQSVRAVVRAARQQHRAPWLPDRARRLIRSLGSNPVSSCRQPSHNP